MSGPIFRSNGNWANSYRKALAQNAAAAGEAPAQKAEGAAIFQVPAASRPAPLARSFAGYAPGNAPEQKGKGRRQSRRNRRQRSRRNRQSRRRQSRRN